MELKMWYITDGGTFDGRPCIRMDNESEYIEKHKENIMEIGITPTIVDEDSQLNILKDDWPRFFEYLGAPVPGFEYKWVLSDE